MGRDVRESLWKGVEALLRGLCLEVSVCAVCWKGWRLVVGGDIVQGLVKRWEDGERRFT